jgi:hypothetical protein
MSANLAAADCRRLRRRPAACAAAFQPIGPMPNIEY